MSDGGLCHNCGEPIDDCRCRMMAVEITKWSGHYVTFPYIEEKEDARRRRHERR